MADDEIRIDSQAFQNRLNGFLSHWKAEKRSSDGELAGVGSIAICAGSNPRQDDRNSKNQRTAAFMMWILGYEFPTTLFVLTPESLTVITTKKKSQLLQPLKGGKVPVDILVRSKNAEENQKHFDKCLDIVKAGGKKVGVLAAEKDVAAGAVPDEWRQAFKGIEKDVEEVDITAPLSTAWAVKDEKELRVIRDASRASTGVLRQYFVEEIISVVDNERKITHKTLADKVMAKIDDDRFFKNLKIAESFDSVQLDWGLPPTVQSGGQYDLKFQSEPDEIYLHSGVIVAGLGLKYQTYGSAVARTYLIDPTKAQEANYKFLLSVYADVLGMLKDGAVCKDVYNKTLSAIKSKKPELASNFVRSIGFGIGTEMQDNVFSINSKNSRTLKDGMTLTITIGFTDLQNTPTPKDKRAATYALVIMDTIRISAGKEPVVFTKGASSDLETVSFFFNDDEEEEKPKSKPKKDSKIGAVAQKNITSKRLRSDRAAIDNSEREAERNKHQSELKSKKQSEGMERYRKGFGNLNGTEQKTFKRFDSYKRDNQFPGNVKNLAIVVDTKAATIILPIMGRPVPFHINTIKNASTTQEGGFTSLRINFLSPGQGVGRKDDQPFEDANAHFVRSLTFRSKDGNHMEDVTSQITDLKKELSRKELEKKQMEDVVEQDKLMTTKDRKPNVMDLVFMRPALDGKRVPGTLQIHQNGLRYVHGMGGTHVDVLFSNIKHLFFQPCEKTEMIVIIHAHLINPIMIGKKKTKDVQFYREATEMAFDETGNRQRRRRMGDEEEFQQEQEERKRRAELDRHFKSFAQKIEAASETVDQAVQVDIPVRALNFNGVHSRSSVTMQPTTDCLVQLSEPPFYVITLADIEIVHLERVQFGLKNFDMVFVFKDFTRPPSHINTIPVENLDSVKDWLDSVDIPFSEGPLNLNWAQIMKTITTDPHNFFEEGGWGFLGASDSENEDDEEEEESVFEISEEEMGSVVSSEDESDFGDDGDASADESEGSGSDDEEGEDWDELEKKARRKDREIGHDDDEEDRGKKRKR
ncbi:transcription elongation complex subunit [Aulographum hederae CBS 113979]|uniref:FACT complex subunit n=1 Tax=Aulographum hederae CBS 113979 TaxID=1176131 RepID=A0A6G1GSW5_9PEZI|nr:transcription elongation complex subunit [Aulographum hederae CBS 113979]